jgi:hypothetical protein
LRDIDSTETRIAERATAVSTHAKAARAFLDQAASSPETAAFVSAYYAALNLAKVCILFSPKYDQLAANRYHGVTHAPTSSPNTLADDQLMLKRGGTIPLFYEVLTGEEITSQTRIAMRDVYALIADISSEWAIATGGVSWIADLSFKTISAKEGAKLKVTVESPLTDPLLLDQLPALRKVQPVAEADEGQQFVSDRTASEDSMSAVFDEVLDRRLLYYPPASGARVAIGNMAGLLVVEELPLILAFYHLSSVARYDPEFMSTIRSSRYWPVAAALTSHGLYKFLLLTWCYVRQRHVRITRD